MTTQDHDAELDAKLRAYSKARALNQSREYLAKVARNAERLAEALARYSTELDDETTARSDRFSWALNEIENFNRNVNFAQAATICAELAAHK